MKGRSRSDVGACGTPCARGAAVGAIRHRRRAPIARLRAIGGTRPGRRRRSAASLDAVRTNQNAGVSSSSTRGRRHSAIRIRFAAHPHQRCEAHVVICSGGVSRALGVPGAELTVTPADAFSLAAVPKSMIVIGAGATGAQVASIFNALGSSVTLCQSGPRIVETEDAEVSEAVASAFREDGIAIIEGVRVERIDSTAAGFASRSRARNRLKPRWSSARSAGGPRRRHSNLRKPASKPMREGSSTSTTRCARAHPTCMQPATSSAGRCSCHQPCVTDSSPETTLQGASG